ncbi:hypothetical protein Rsub_02634 [Raphidocelis subcapitata]|uniref:Protein phosphatase inhibitor 2 n=1 Tax=Raphidocelis subcapitata TaxID=307507 RepID=A0A2V0NWI3_9CHLO|nr:hypothetical protein Rsub_02634 [Raphidocelis subcapitata]|eukprot:GBF89930.1 hypothetical protein Rsub_02634 [Raphidocelis subcapitata]
MEGDQEQGGQQTHLQQQQQQQDLEQELGEPQAGQQRTKPGRRLQWDEQNLLDNAQIQASFAGVTIPEPKTPYHGPSPPEDLDDDLRPLALGDDGQRGLTAFDYVMSNGGAEFGQGRGGASPPAPALAPAPPPPPAVAAAVAAAVADAAAARGRERSDTGDGAVSSGKRSERSMSEGRSFNSSDNSGGLSSEKRQRFEAARRAHYNMREALRLGRFRQQLTSGSGDDTGGNGGGGGGSVGRRSDDEDEDEHMRDCGSSRLNEAGLQVEAAADGSVGKRRLNGGAHGSAD